MKESNDIKETVAFCFGTVLDMVLAMMIAIARGTAVAMIMAMAMVISETAAKQ